MASTSIRAKEARKVKLKPMAFAPAATFVIRNELESDIVIEAEGSQLAIKKA
jgi:hypothetical protein